jgi:hypothetical protein
LVNDEKGILSELNCICGKEEHVFSRIRMPKKILPMFVSMVEVREEGLVEEHMEINIGIEAPIKSKILSHFIKGKISLTPMETILIIPRELEYLEGLVKLVRRKDVENHINQITIVHQTPTIKRISVNNTH